MSNAANNGTLIGRLARDPKGFSNQDGSMKVAFTIFTDRDFKNRNGERLSDAIPVEVFLSKDADFAKNPFLNIHKGDLVALSTTLRMDRYTNNGEEIFSLKVVAESVKFLESRQAVQSRLAQRVAAAEQVNQEAPAAQPAAVAVAAGTESAMHDELPFGN